MINIGHIYQGDFKNYLDGKGNLYRPNIDREIGNYSLDEKIGI